MSISVEADRDISATIDYRRALSAVNSLPDHCAPDVGELASRIGADKLDLIRWAREDIRFARLIASKVAA
jgi:hypothetical protein